MDDDLDADEVEDGDWLSFGLDTTGSDAAFTDEDGDDLTYSVSVVDSDGGAVDWLQISDSGKMTNKEGMLPERGVYTVTVTATDEGENSAQTSFKLAVALSDEDDRDNDTPDIRDVEEYDYTEGSGAQMVATFSVRDDDVAIAPHPYGTHTVTLSGSHANRFKLVETGRDEDSVHFAIYTKSAAELAVDDKGKALKTPVKPLDHDESNGDEVDITVKVVDGAGEEDDKEITIDVDDVDDEAPAFSQASIAEPIKASRKVDAKTKAGTTSLTVNQEQSDKLVVVVQLSEVWSDVDSDEDDLDFDVGGRSGLPDWVTVYGPDDWEDIYDRRSAVDESDAPSGTRDGDQVIVIVIDRTSGEDGDNEGVGTGACQLYADGH